MTSITNLFGVKQIEGDSSFNLPLIFEEINKELEECLFEKSVHTDSTDDAFDFLEILSNQVQEDFDELIGEDTNKKRFIKTLMHIFALILNTKLDTKNKIKRIIKIAIETTLKVWRAQK